MSTNIYYFSVTNVSSSEPNKICILFFDKDFFLQSMAELNARRIYGKYLEPILKLYA